MKKFSKILLISLAVFLIVIAVSVRAQDETPPAVSVEGAPADWQNSPATAYVFCEDEAEGSGCDDTSYKLKIYDSDPVICSDIYDDYAFCNGSSCTSTNPQAISSHQWVCGTAKDLAGNIGFSEPVEFKVDTTLPTGTIVASPTAVRANESINITVNGEDNIDMGAVCYKEENDLDWACYTCSGIFCSHTFERSESTVKKYKYYGYVIDAVVNGNFTVPDHIIVLVETDPSVVADLATDVQTNQAALNGDLTDMGGASSVDVWFEWGTTIGYGNITSIQSKTTTGTFSAAITGLSSGQTYHFRAVAQNDVGIAYGDDIEFITFIELVNNGGFETGDLTGWTTVGTGNHQADTEDKYSGSYAGLIGYKTAPIVKNGKSAIYQDVTIPSATTNINLSLWYKFYTTDECPYDWINIYLKDTSDNILKTYLEWCCSGCGTGELNIHGWNQLTDDLSDLAGQTVRIYFEVENRSDKFHRSWAYIDDVSIRYISTGLPSVVTQSATGIETTSAVLNGELTDLGGASSVEVWFEWGTTIGYGNETEPLSLTATGNFSAAITGLSSAMTYHFRTVAQSGAGTSYGSDKEFTTEYSAAGGWISPTGYEDPDSDWWDEPLAYDNDLITYALNNWDVGWGGFLVLTLSSPITSDKIRVNADYSNVDIQEVDIDVLKGGIWVDVHQGAIANCAWEEISFPEGSVTKARFRYNYKTNGGAYWLYEFQFYKVPDEPITPPAGNTLEATSVEENSAILHGEVTDDGGETTQIRFQYGKTEAYGTDTPWEGSWASGEKFGKLISGLEENVTYHFRAQIKNSAGVSTGADKTFFTQSAASGWVSPTGFNDPDGEWEDEVYAYDDEITTYTRSFHNMDDPQLPSYYLYLTHPAISSDKIRFYARGGDDVDAVSIDVYKDGAWENIYDGSFIDRQWVEATFAGGTVSQVQIKFHATYQNHGFFWQLYEFDFWKIAESPSVTTNAATDVQINQATLNGNLTDLGGASSVDVWFKWGETIGYGNITSIQSKTTTGTFNAAITGLSSAMTYHFKTVASSAAGTFYGSDMEFTTLGECIFGETTTCTSGEGCDHTIECTAEGTWPPCPRDVCVKNTTDSPDCPCPEDYCTDADGDGYEDDLVNYPDYGDCTDSCACDIGTDPGQPCEPTIDYNDLQCNQPPAINLNVTDDNYCGYSSPPIWLNWNFSDPDVGDTQAAYYIQVDNDADFSSPEVNVCVYDAAKISDPTGTCTAGSGGSTTYVPTFSYGAPNYYWQLRVWDDKGLASDWTIYQDNNPPPESFTAFPEPPRVNFTCNGQGDCSTVPVSGEEIVILEDTSTCPGAGLCSSRTWTLPPGATMVNPDPPDYAFSPIEVIFIEDPNPQPVKLYVEDNNYPGSPPGNPGYSCDTTEYLNVALPLPEWREILPTGWLKKFWASLFSFFQV